MISYSIVSRFRQSYLKNYMPSNYKRKLTLALSFMLILLAIFGCRKKIAPHPTTPTEMGFVSLGDNEFPTWKSYFKARFDENKIAQGIFTLWHKKRDVFPFGTAFLISDEGYLLTALHTVSTCYNPRKKLPQTCSPESMKLVFRQNINGQESFQTIPFTILKTGFYKTNSEGCQTAEDSDFDVALIKIKHLPATAKPLKIMRGVPTLPFRTFAPGFIFKKYSTEFLKQAQQTNLYPVKNASSKLSFSTGLITKPANGNLISDNLPRQNSAIDVFYGNSGSPFILSDGPVVALHYSEKKNFDDKCRAKREASFHIRSVSMTKIILLFNLEIVPSIKKNIIY